MIRHLWGAVPAALTQANKTTPLVFWSRPAARRRCAWLMNRDMHRMVRRRSASMQGGGGALAAPCALASLARPPAARSRRARSSGRT